MNTNYYIAGAKDRIEELEQLLRLLLDQVDYTAGACRVNEMVGAVLPEEILARVKGALQPASLKQKFIRKLAKYAECRSIALAELHPETGIDLMLECLPPKPTNPPAPRPAEMPKGMWFMGVPLRANESVPRGELWVVYA